MFLSLFVNGWPHVSQLGGSLCDVKLFNSAPELVIKLDEVRSAIWLLVLRKTGNSKLLDEVHRAKCRFLLT